MQGNGVAVVFTSPGPTMAALEAARKLTRASDRPVPLYVMVAVPYPLPLTSPPVPLSFTERQVRRFAAQAPVATQVEVCLCRDRREGLLEVLEPGSVVVLGGQKHWWRRGAEEGLAHWLQDHGHSVVLAPPEEANAV